MLLSLNMSVLRQIAIPVLSGFIPRRTEGSYALFLAFRSDDIVLDARGRLKRSEWRRPVSQPDLSVKGICIPPIVSHSFHGSTAVTMALDRK